MEKSFSRKDLEQYELDIFIGELYEALLKDNTYRLVDEIILKDNLGIDIFKKVEKNKEIYFFFLKKENKIIGYKLWIVKRLLNNKVKIFASMSDIEISGLLKLTSETMAVLFSERGKGYGKILYGKTLKYLVDELKNKNISEAEVITMSTVPDFHNKIIQELIDVLNGNWLQKNIENNSGYFRIKIPF